MLQLYVMLTCFWNLSNSLGLRASIGQVSASLRPVQQAILSDSIEYITLIWCAILHRFRQSILSILQTLLRYLARNLSDRIWLFLQEALSLKGSISLLRPFQLIDILVWWNSLRDEIGSRYFDFALIALSTHLILWYVKYIYMLWGQSAIICPVAVQKFIVSLITWPSIPSGSARML